MANRLSLVRVICLLMIACLLWGCEKDADKPKEEKGPTSLSHLPAHTVIGQVNGVPVQLNKFERAFTQRLKVMKIKIETVSAAEAQLMEMGTFESLITRTLLLQEAQKRGFVVDDTSLKEAKNQILKTLPEGMTPESFIRDLDITMQTFEAEIREDMLIAMLQETVARAGQEDFDSLVGRLESAAKVEMKHAPGGKKWTKRTPPQGEGIQPAVKPTSPAQVAPGDKKKNWRDQSRQIRRKKAEQDGVKPWEEGYPE